MWMQNPIPPTFDSMPQLKELKLPCASLYKAAGGYSTKNIHHSSGRFTDLAHMFCWCLWLPSPEHLRGGLRQIIGLALVARRRTNCKTLILNSVLYVRCETMPYLQKA